jgi:dihydropteroate synthase
MIATLDCGGKTLDLSRTLVMGVLNVTPDSFSDGGRYGSVSEATRQAERMAGAGAAIIDIGGESTRPGAAPVSEAEELERVIPVIEALVQAGLGVPLSVDTSKPAVMRAAVVAGAGMINDVRALREPGALEAARDCGVPVCLMHMQGEPRSMQDAPTYADVVEDVCGFLSGRVDACLAAGIDRGRLLLDPGLGFGKNLEHNLKLLKHLDQLTELGPPLLVGLSRKRMIGELLDAPVDRRLFGSVAGAVLAAWQGASIVRVHDVGPTVEALKVCDALRAIP